MLITPAYAQAAAGGDANSMLMSLLPFALIFVIMYFLIARQGRAGQGKERGQGRDVGELSFPRRLPRRIF